MDNITHSLYGALGAEVLLRSFPKLRRSRPFETAFRWVLVAGNNFPDLDVLYAGISPGALGRLLHHRGHTHTVGLALPQAGLMMLAVAAVLAWINFRGRKQSRPRVSFSPLEWLILTGVGALGVCMHMAADWTNSYGVHPFWPMSSAWTYGDAVFILEPLLWIVMFPWVIWTARAKFFRALGVVLMTGLGALALFSGLVPIGIQAVLFSLALSLLYLFGPFRGGAFRTHAWKVSAASVVLLLTGWFWVGSVGARGISAALKLSQPEFVLGDLALSPLPANPFCLRGTTVGFAREFGDLSGKQTSAAAPQWYRSELVVMAPWPSVMSIEDCIPYFGRDRGAGGRVEWLEPGRVMEGGRVAAFKRFEAPREELENLWKNDCHFRGFLRFSRMPIWHPKERWLGDLRFDMASVRPGKKTRFLELDWKEATESGRCTPNLPHWDAPISRWWERLSGSAWLDPDQSG
jgi:inner membrane protein